MGTTNRNIEWATCLATCIQHLPRCFCETGRNLNATIKNKFCNKPNSSKLPLRMDQKYNQKLLPQVANKYA